MFKVMIRDTMSPVAKEILEATGKIEVVVDNNKATNAPSELVKIIGDFDVTFKTAFKAASLDSCLQILTRCADPNTAAR